MAQLINNGFGFSRFTNRDDFRFWEEIAFSHIIRKNPVDAKIVRATAFIAYENHHAGRRAAVWPALAAFNGKEYAGFLK